MLAGAGLAASAGLYVAFRLGRRYLLENLDAFQMPVDVAPDAWLHVTPEGLVRLMMPKAEMGQGVHSALQQIVAEELFVPLDQVTVVRGDTTVLPVDSRGTNGSTTIASLYPGLRQAAAYAREMLKAEAAKRLGVAVEALQVVAGVIVANGQPTPLTYGALLGDQPIVNVLGEDVAPPLKPVAEFEIIGQPVRRSDLADKVNGAALYGYDARRPGMVFGKVLKPPTIGATLKRAEASAARAQAGVVAVVEDGDFIGVVAETQEAANVALYRITAEWTPPSRPVDQAMVDALVVAGGAGGEVIKETGDVEAGLRVGALVTAEYRTPLAAHAMLEPLAALAEVRQEAGAWRAEVWTATQSAGLIQTQVGQALGIDPAQVVIHPLYLGGGFGRKIVAEAAVEAARLSKAVGRPVRVNWDRTEEFQHSFLRPPTHSRLRATLEEGRVRAWDHAQASGLVLFSFLPAVLRSLFGSDFGATRGAVPRQYAFADQRTTAWMRETPVKTGSWRGLGLLPNTFAVESFMDELAHAAGADPVAFRLAHLGAEGFGQRMRRALERVAVLAGWGQPLPAPAPGWQVGRGVACAEDARTVVAQVAEVAVQPATGEIRVQRVFCTVDCGLVINPDTVRAQVEGNVMWGVSATLIEEVKLQDGRVSASNFGEYPLLTIGQAPEVITEIIPNTDEGPYGMGEPPIGPVAAAIGNAVFAATGRRLRQLPMNPARVLAAG